MAVSFECPDCRTRWPHTRRFSSCPECRVVCYSNVVPRSLTEREADSRLRRLEFVRYYRARENFRTGPTPEEIGRAEAKIEAAKIRAEKLTQNAKDPG
jgi:hypothetical protein